MASAPDPGRRQSGSTAGDEILPPGPQEGVRPGRTLGLAVLGALIIFTSAATTRIQEVPLSAQLGLLQVLPPGYWLGLGLIGASLAWSLRCRSEKLTVLTGVLFFAIFAGTGSLFLPHPPVWDAYSHFGRAQDIALGRLPSSPQEYAANWPGFFLNVRFLEALTGLPPILIISIFPFLTAGVTYLCLFLFLRTLTSPSRAGVGATLASLLNVWAQYWIAPQSFGLFLAFLVLATMWRREPAARVANAILFLGLVVTHPTSTVLLLTVLFADLGLSQIRRVLHRDQAARDGSEGGFPHNPAITYGIVWLGWLFLRATGSASTVTTTLFSRIGLILRVPEQTVNLATQRTVENLYFWPPLIRIAALFVYFLVGIRALIWLWKGRGSQRLAQVLAAMIGGLVLVAFADILAFGGELYDRSLMLFAAIAPVICLAGLGRRRMQPKVRVAVIAALVAASLVTASTALYLASFYYVSGESMAASNFLQRVDPESTVLDGLYPVPVWIPPEKRISPSQPGFYEVYPRRFSDFGGPLPVYAVFDGTATLWYRQLRGIESYRPYAADRFNYPLIYDNGKVQVHLIN